MWWKIFLVALFMTLGVELLILFFLSLTEDALGQPVAQAHHISALARKINRLGAEKTATFLSFADPESGQIWLEDARGLVIMGEPNPHLTWPKRLTLTENKNLDSHIAIWKTADYTLFRTPVYLDGQKLFLFQAHKVYWRLAKSDHFIQGFFCLLLVSAIFSFFVVKKAAQPIKRLQSELTPVIEGDLNARVTASGAGLVAGIAEGVNLLTRTLAAREESLVTVAKVLSQGRDFLAQSRLNAARLEEWLAQGSISRAETSLLELSRAINQLDRHLGELLLFHKLDFEKSAFKMAKVSLSALAFETTVRYRELAGPGALESRVASKLFVKGHNDLLIILLSRFLEGLLDLTPKRPIRLILEKVGPEVALSGELAWEETLKDLEDKIWPPSFNHSPLSLGLPLARKIADFSQAKTRTHRLANGLAKIEFLFALYN
jgi:hypothetical protein